MEKGFFNRNDWWTVTAALVVWTVHLAGVWVASIIFPGQAVGRWLALPLTLAAAGALAWLWVNAGRPRLYSTPGLGLAIAAGGVVFDVLPAVIG